MSAQGILIARFPANSAPHHGPNWKRLSGIFFRLLSSNLPKCARMAVDDHTADSQYARNISREDRRSLREGSYSRMTVLRQMTKGGHQNYGLGGENFFLISGQNSEPRLDSRSNPS